jgi:2-hydroxychromene-2-carboxylate isomerase/catechol 2,3-dioxygenase-like lactoylglutathione lyase family enzyme
MRFYFDFISPYAWLAWNRVHALAARHGRQVEPVPVLLAVLLDHGGQKGPAEVPAKKVHMMRQLLRLAAREGIPLVPPPVHPFNPVPAMSVASLDHPDRRRIVDALFTAVWGGGPGVADAEGVTRVLDAAGLDGAALVAASRDGRARLRASTAAAIEAGVFGVPTVVVGGELFWGFDSFADIDASLSGRYPLDREALGRWQATPVGVTRGGPHHGLSHLSVAVADLDRTARFYAALGYAPYYRDETSVQLVRPGGAEVLAFELGPRAGTPGGIDHFGFRLKTPDAIDGVLAALLAAGGHLDRRGAFEPGKPYAYVRDPDGYEIEVWFE